jgi:hypothetical protein
MKHVSTVVRKTVWIITAEIQKNDSCTFSNMNYFFLFSIWTLKDSKRPRTVLHTRVNFDRFDGKFCSTPIFRHHRGMWPGRSKSNAWMILKKILLSFFVEEQYRRTLVEILTFFLKEKPISADVTKAENKVIAHVFVGIPLAVCHVAHYRSWNFFDTGFLSLSHTHKHPYAHVLCQICVFGNKSVERTISPTRVSRTFIQRKIVYDFTKLATLSSKYLKIGLLRTRPSRKQNTTLKIRVAFFIKLQEKKWLVKFFF